jgi:hypothetical protein
LYVRCGKCLNWFDAFQYMLCPHCPNIS